MALIKLVTILVIVYKSAYLNNSNYIPLLIKMYLYSAGTQIDAITLLDHLGISVLSTVFMKKSRDITTSSIVFMKE